MMEAIKIHAFCLWYVKMIFWLVGEESRWFFEDNGIYKPDNAEITDQMQCKIFWKKSLRHLVAITTAGRVTAAAITPTVTVVAGTSSILCRTGV